MIDINHLEALTTQVRRDILRMVHKVNSGHPGGSLGCAEFIITLFNVIMERNNSFEMDGHNEDIFFLSNGHISLPCFLVNFPFMNLLGLTNDSCAAWIKRVVAVGGDQVSVNPRGEVRVNGEKIKEPYVTNYCPVDGQGMGPCKSLSATVPRDHVLVLGDNRINSTDGRTWGFLPESEILGRAVWRFWPFNRLGSLTP